MIYDLFLLIGCIAIVLSPLLVEWLSHEPFKGLLRRLSPIHTSRQHDIMNA